ncbi:cobyric acid synthase [uncultured Roseobacter sp.]|uniref:cobyric acid synthase n=1 Tax=uncultured Roseobacter sp. TaxID=114847 RepID=UPI0026357512|nr:cobyric acid synthase [uncultured Roseobacter sp.]
MARAIMIQGTGSNVGKSMIVAGLARACVRRGMSVRPFKPQNMSNNAAVTIDGGEIGRAQALQARAAGIAPHTDMNPVLLKPQSSTGAQIIVQGQVFGHQEARVFGSAKDQLMPYVLESFHRLADGCDLVLVEGAGSPAETNLRPRDIANMGFAHAAGVPVVLMGDIDRGGVIAQVVGTQVVLGESDQDMIKAFMINKFRGDIKLFDEGRDDICARTGWPCLGVLPWFQQAGKLPAEDIADLPARARSEGKGVRIVVPQLPRLSNFDDLDPLVAEPAVELIVAPPGAPLPLADVILLGGSKATLTDLDALRAQGWDIDIAAHVRRGGHVLGLCGGYQMLGRTIADPDGLEGPARTAAGLGHLDVETVLAPRKTLALSTAVHAASGASVAGYEIHMGQTDGPDCTNGWLQTSAGLAGASALSGQILGCYMHGIFTSDNFRAAWLASLGQVAQTAYDAEVEHTLDALTAHLEDHMDLDALLALATPVGPRG